MKPNYTALGFSNIMGNKLRNKVEEQLINDLMEYGIKENRFKFDWSESIIEGKRTAYLDGEVENFSGIKVYDANDEMVAEGWMEYLYDENESFFIAFWEFLSIYREGKENEIKKESGIPAHVLSKLPKYTRENIDEIY